MSQRQSHENRSPNIDDRIRGAIWGQFIGDAFCLGSHWIYDLTELARRFPRGLKGFETPASGHYHFGKKSGDLTHYGDGALLQLQSLAERGAFDAVDFGARFVAMIESSEYQGYRDHAAKGTVDNIRAFRDTHPGETCLYQSGADDDQPATVSRLAPVAARHYRDSDYAAIVERATRVCQNNDRAVAYATAHALVLREIFSGHLLQEAFQRTVGLMAGQGAAGEEVADKINDALVAQDLSVTKATQKFGQTCPLAASFPAAVHCALRHGDDFSGALQATASAGGDSAGRAAMIGAWLGSSLGIDALPAQWCERLAARDTISDCVERVVMLAHGISA